VEVRVLSGASKLSRKPAVSAVVSAQSASKSLMLAECSGQIGALFGTMG
jgi:hypothetical protein